jgi:hypothetical protein
MEKILLYNFLYTTYTINCGVVVDPLCNAYTVINIGTSIAYVNGVPLNPGTPGTNNGESISQGGNRAEIFRGRIDIAFDGAKGKIVIIQKIYLPNQLNNS